MSPVMRALLLLVALTIAAGQESRFDKVKESKTILTTDVTYKPPMIILGKSNGTIIRCPLTTPTDCEVYHAGNSSVTAIAVHGEFLFASLASGDILRCIWQRTHSCSVFPQAAAGTEIIGLAVTAGFLYAGLWNGTILQCELATPHSCHRHTTLDENIFSLTAIGSLLYVGLDNSRINTCSATIESNCSLFYEGLPFTSEIVGLAHAGDNIFGLRSGGYIHICSDSAASPRCDNFEIPILGCRKMAVYNRKLYMISNDQIFVSDPASGNSVSSLAESEAHKDAVSISIAYGTHAMQAKYRMESEKCIWNGIFKCPPTVFHYEVQDRSPLEVTVKYGRLYDSQGTLVDTSDADEIRSQRAAIFVMGPDGQLLLSNYHKMGLLLTSSLLAGNPVSGAGLIVVESGKIRNITACSVHYRPDLDLNKQVIESLYLKGYTDRIESYACTYSEMLCGQENTIENYV